MENFRLGLYFQYNCKLGNFNFLKVRTLQLNLSTVRNLRPFLLKNITRMFRSATQGRAPRSKNKKKMGEKREQEEKKNEKGEERREEKENEG